MKSTFYDQLFKRITWQQFNIIEGPSPDDRGDDPSTDIDIFSTNILNILGNKKDYREIHDLLKKINKNINNNIPEYYLLNDISEGFKHKRKVELNRNLLYIFE